MGCRAVSVARETGVRTFAVIRLERDWQDEEIRRFRTGLTLREQLIVVPVLNTTNLTEIVFRCDSGEAVAIRRVLDDITPGASRALFEFVAAHNIDQAMSPSQRDYV